MFSRQSNRLILVLPLIGLLLGATHAEEETRENDLLTAVDEQPAKTASPPFSPMTGLRIQPYDSPPSDKTESVNNSASIDSSGSSESKEQKLPTGHEGDFEWYFQIRPEQRNLFLNLNGYAWHFKKGDESEEKVNDWPLGFGLTYELRRKENYIWTADGDIFIVDSNNDFAAALGSTILWRTRFVDIGVRGGLLFKQNFKEDWGVPLAPIILPTFQWDLHYFALKVIYIPGIRKSTDEQLFFQILVPLGGPR